MSADLDGEASASDLAALHSHLGECHQCQQLSASFVGLHRSVRIRPAQPTPDLVHAVLASARTPRVGRWEWVRYSLGVIAGTNLLLGVPDFLTRTDGQGHDSRHLGAFTIAVSIGLLFAALRPERANGLLPFATALGFTMVLGALVDTLQNQRSMLAESTHLLDLVGLGLLWYLAGGARGLSDIGANVGGARSMATGA